MFDNHNAQLKFDFFLTLNWSSDHTADYSLKGMFLEEKLRQRISSSDPFYLHGSTLIPAWINNYIHYKVWDEITYPFLNFNGATVEV